MSPTLPSKWVSLPLLAFVAACGGSTNDQPDQGEASEPALGYDSCYEHTASHGWENGFFPQQSGWFRASMVAVPTAANIDGVLGLSNGPADAFTDLAAIVRFNPSGFIDARKGSAYAADAVVPYRAMEHYRVDLTVDVPRRVYDVALGFSDGSAVGLASQYPFRTEQAGATRLDNFARIVDGTAGGIFPCSFWAQSIDASCTSQSAGTPWVNQSFPRQSGRFDVWFTAYVNNSTADYGFADAVIGLSSGPPGRFTDLAAIVRFNPNGSFDVRNGSVYMSDFGLPYEASKIYRFRMEIDVGSKTYSVYIGPELGPLQVIATNYHFRTEQASVTSLAHVGQYVDSPTGASHVCNLMIDYTL